MTTTNVPKVFIPCGIPTSGKSTWIENFLIPQGFKVISRDNIRLELFGKKYKSSKDAEDLVTRMFDFSLEKAISINKDIVLDNTHCKNAYLKAAISKFSGTNYEIYIVFFDIPIWKAYLRNIIRNWKTGKWIPVKVIKAMFKSYNKINKDEYKIYK